MPQFIFFSGARQHNKQQWKLDFVLIFFHSRCFYRDVAMKNLELNFLFIFHLEFVYINFSSAELIVESFPISRNIIKMS